MTQTLLELLVAEGRITPAALTAARSRAAQAGEPAVVALLSAGVIEEGELISALSQRLGWPRASDERLLHARLAPPLRERIPETLARACLALPLAFDEQRRILTVALGDPTEASVCEQLRRAADAAELRLLVARCSLLQRAVTACYAAEPAPPARPVVSPATRWRDGAPQTEAEGAVRAPGVGGAAARAVAASRERAGQRRPPPPPDAAAGPLLEDALEAVGVLVAMLEERVDPQRARSRELARLTRALLRELGGEPALVARAGLAAHLFGLDITLRQELGARDLPQVAECFAAEHAGTGGLGPVLRALGRQALAREAALAGGDRPLPTVEGAIEAVTRFLVLGGEGIPAAQIFAALRVATVDAALIEGLARVTQRAESRSRAAATVASDPRDGSPHPKPSGAHER
ncbi:MAG: hypothetical protein IPL40_14075 [Proteobacteria bacterium]|nr:hypothetical protein [Pseudomonadota bacterium]